jgi:hypothetical protein
MPSFSGSFLYQPAQGSAAQPCPCRLDFDDETLTLIPGSGAPLACDLGDIDELMPKDYELHLKLYTGDRIVLSRMGKSFQDLEHDLGEAYRKRLVRCLLLDDLEEIERFDSNAELQAPDVAFSAPAELRLYQSNLAALPQGRTGLQWRLADIDSVNFDDTRYAVVVKSGNETLLLSRLAKRTSEFLERLQSAMTEVSSRSAASVRTVFPFLSPEQFRRAAGLLKEGRVAPIAQLASIHAKTVPALAEMVVRASAKPYYDYLAARTAPNGFYAGFKLIRKEAPESEEDAGDTAPDLEVSGIPAQTMEAMAAAGEQSDTEMLHWFIFPLRPQNGAGVPQIAAWETTSRTGRATYFFRLFSPDEACALAEPARAAAALDNAVRVLNRGLVLLNFRRSPIYLPDDALEMQPRYRRYAIACRKLPAVRFLRSSFLGRALHTSPQSWQHEVEHLLSG